MAVRFQGITIIHNSNPPLAERRSEELTSKRFEMSLMSQDYKTGAFYNITEGDMVALMQDALQVTIDPELCKVSPAEAKASVPLMGRIDAAFQEIMAAVQRIGGDVFQNRVTEYVRKRKDEHHNTDADGAEIQEEFATIAGLISIRKKD